MIKNNLSLEDSRVVLKERIEKEEEHVVDSGIGADVEHESSNRDAAEGNDE